ncbi:MAG TPA: hypothetical protein VGE62_00305 [Candidatus Paceibacterota bacterium]
MNMKFALGAFIIAIAAFGLFAYTQKGSGGLIGNATTTESDLSSVQHGGEAEFSVSFICKDENHFVAEFLPGDQVRVLKSGNDVGTFTRTDGNGMRYENASVSYVFAGEEAHVTNKASGSETTCSQPFDPNNAPYNFGDAAEGAGADQDLSGIVKVSIVGAWKSIDDSKSVREFKADGKVADIYDGKTVASDFWDVFMKGSAPKVSFPVEEGVVYVRLTGTGPDAEALTFKVVKVTPEELEIVYMERGNVLRYERVK